MWTRIQILYISIATILVGAMFFCDFATIIGPEGSEVTIAYREKIPFLILNIMALTAQISALASTKEKQVASKNTSKAVLGYHHRHRKHLKTGP